MHVLSRRWYSGRGSVVIHDIEVMRKEAGIVGLELNPQNSEVISINLDLIATVQWSVRG